MSTTPRTVPSQVGHSFVSRRFEIKRRLGEGSMGAVYLAYDRERGTDVALKTLRRVDPGGIYGFKREFRALSDVVHPNLVALYDLFQEGELWYFTMEHVAGVDFITYLHGSPRESVWATPRTAPTLEALASSTTPAEQPQARGLELLFPTLVRDEDELRHVLIQITHALLAIHAAGKLHRDLKSDNVLVTSDGLAKVLDFGIVTDRAQGLNATLEFGVMGTPAYMSPEQAAGRPVDDATDWYALGVMLYEALTGHVPFDGGYLEVMNQKQHQDPPPPSALVSAVPPDLDELCVALLRREPHARPSGLAVLRALEQKRPPSLRPPSHGSASSVPVDADAPFVGRSDELSALRRHLAETDRGQPVVTLIQGPSGMGKTTLVEHFLAEQREQGRAVVLRGRCYERETMPFKAWDSLIDSLSRHLRRLPAVDAAEILPRDILALGQLFPVLRRVEVVAGARRRTGLPQDRKELRRRAFTALKELLCRLADRAPLLLFIDDLQWGDFDSAQLLSELIRGSDAPAMLLMLTHRSGELSSSPCLQTLLDLRQNDEAAVHLLELQPLGEQESVELARRLLPGEAPAAASGLGLESQGSPHLLTELVRHLIASKQAGTASPDTQRGIVTFERVLMQRVAELSPGSRTLLELLSVAGRPVTEESLSLVSSFDIDLQQAVTELRGAKLIRGVGAHARRAIETYHDRIREAVVDALSAAQLETWHRRLASTLEATGSDDLEAIVEHLLGAGDKRRAQVYALRAAAQAAEALAFEKAARLFAIAVQNQSDEGSSHELLVRWADALVNAGHARQAAVVYFDAAGSAAEPEASSLRRKAGLQLLASGHDEDALALLGGTLDQLGIVIPESAKAGAAELSTLLAAIAERGFELRAREGAIPVEEIERVDTLWTLTLSLTQSTPDRALVLVARHLLAALELGDPVRAVRGLCLYHNMLETPPAQEGGPAQGAQAAAEALASALQQPEPEARIELSHGLDAMRRAKLRPALRALSRAEELFRTRCPGMGSEMRMCR
ncbi:MAG: serine/threonine-protein kinase PknK, partial [Polyangiales bacterium]